MTKVIDPDLLKTLIAVADGGTFGRAADRVHRSQSAISMQMSRLEALVGVPLFERQGRGLRLTSRGELLVVYARRIIRLQNEAWLSIADPEIAGSIRFGTPEDYADWLLPPVLGRFASSHPLVEVEIRCDPSQDLCDLAAAGELDLALITRAPTRPRGDLVRHEPLVWAASPHYASRSGEPVPVALFQPGCPTRCHVVEALAAAGIRHRVAYSSPSLAGLLAVVRAGLAVTALARCSVPRDLRILSPREGLPDLQPVELALLRPRAEQRTRASEALADEILVQFQAGDRIPEFLLSPKRQSADARIA
jgi:DNA-binding transcriptional LysR family regulator